MTKPFRLPNALKAIIFLLSAGTGSAFASQPADTIIISHDLMEVEVMTVGSRKLINPDNNGHIHISSALLSDIPSFLGGKDPMFLLRSLPAVGTANELSPAISIRGCTSGANLFETDGTRIINPMHMLGLYSAFNSDFYSDFIFKPGAIDVTSANLTGGYLGANSMGLIPDSIFSGSLSVGLIESHGALHIPLLKGKSSFSLGARTTYLNLIYPNLLKAGTSALSYSFSDINANFMWMPDSDNLVRASFFGDKDRLSMHNSNNGTKEGNFGWKNLATGLDWIHRNLSVHANFCSFSNNFLLQEGGRTINLPSTFSQSSLSFLSHIRNFSLSCDVNYRFSSGQGIRNDKRNVPGHSSAIEMNLAGEWHKSLPKNLSFDIGIRTTLYLKNSYHRFIPQPRVVLNWTPTSVFSIFTAVGRYMHFDKIVEETTGGLPADFYINTDALIPPEDVYSAELGFSGKLPLLGLQYSIDGYYKILRNVTEYKGSLLSLVNNNYNPLDDVINGHGFATGLSVALMRQWGRLRGRVAYNLGMSRLKFDEYGQYFFPSAHDRLHDFNASLSWSALDNLSANLTFVHATGTPYTRAKYGYMIGENLICEYYPHNSSRLPAYNRMDISASWVFIRTQTTKHTLTFSVYNLLGNNNVLFSFTTYSPEHGIRTKESVMKMVIPSISYSIDF